MTNRVLQKITAAGMQKIAESVATGAQIIISKVIYYAQPVNEAEDENLPSTILYTDVNPELTYTNAETVVYRSKLDTTVGDFTFSAYGLVTNDNVLLAVRFQNDETKRKTAGVTIGNRVIKAMVLNFAHAQSVMNATVNCDFLAVEGATETREGVARIATASEVETGTNNTTIVTPQKLKVKLEGYAPKNHTHSNYALSDHMHERMIGEVKYWAGATAPAHYLELNGQNLSKVDYAALYAILGDVGGTAPAGFFKLPDLRGEFIRCLDSGRGVDSGRSRFSFVGDAMRRLYGVTRICAAVTTGTSGVFQRGTKVMAENSGEGRSIGELIFDSSTQVPTAEEIRPRSVAVMAIICVE